MTTEEQESLCRALIVRPYAQDPTMMPWTEDELAPGRHLWAVLVAAAALILMARRIHGSAE